MLALGVVALVVVATACQDWTGYMGGGGLNGNASGETTIGLGNLSKLAKVYTVPVVGDSAPMTGVTTSGLKLFASSTAQLVAADLQHKTNCSGAPLVCQPLWTASLPNVGPGGASQPLVANHVVYESSDGVNPTGQLQAYDANGVTNCGGSPVVCLPLWSANAPSASGPNVDDGNLFVASPRLGQLQAYDANGVTNCGGSPVVCQPLWTATVSSNSVPSIANGKVYVATKSGGSPALDVYDESGTTNCTGAPKVCQPLFSATLPANTLGSVDVSGGVAYVQTANSNASGTLVAVDANGVTNCSGSPLVCQPLWTAPSAGKADNGTPAVANGRVYTIGNEGVTVLSAYDAAGATNCSGAPKVCQPLFSGPGGVSSESPLVTNGLVFTGAKAWDAAGVVNCVPFCQPVWALADGGQEVTISDGTLLVGGSGGVAAYQIQ